MPGLWLGLLTKLGHMAGRCTAQYNCRWGGHPDSWVAMAAHLRVQVILAGKALQAGTRARKPWRHACRHRSIQGEHIPRGAVHRPALVCKVGCLVSLARLGQAGHGLQGSRVACSCCQACWGAP